jgi:hypothetical protein
MLVKKILAFISSAALRKRCGEAWKAGVKGTYLFFITVKCGKIFMFTVSKNEEVA